jgi:biotin carboxyl carrier protein
MKYVVTLDGEKVEVDLVEREGRLYAFVDGVLLDPTNLDALNAAPAAAGPASAAPAGKTARTGDPDPTGGAPVELVPVRDTGSYSLLLGYRSIPVVAHGPNDELVLTLGAETWKARVEDEREALLAAALGDRGRSGGGTLKAVMPGIVREVRVAAGDAVRKGQALLILEAMKMQNEIRADADGVVAELHVAAGTAVAKGTPLVTLSAPA